MKKEAQCSNFGHFISYFCKPVPFKGSALEASIIFEDKKNFPVEFIDKNWGIVH